MKKIQVFKTFLLNLANGTSRKFEVGLHEVEAAVASHWYTLAHATVVEAEKVETEVIAEIKAVEAKLTKKGK